VPRLSGEQCRHLLATAVAALVSGHAAIPVQAAVSALGSPRWIPVETRQGTAGAWLAPLDVTLSSGGRQAAARIEWPVPWSATAATPCRFAVDQPAEPGVHAGLFIGAPLAVGHGVRLRPGLHVIPRPTPRGAWVVETVVAPRLGRDAYGKDFSTQAGVILGRDPGRYVDAALRTEMLEQLGLESGCQDTQAVGLALERLCARPKRPDDLGWITAQPRRTAAVRNRLFGADETMAELVYARVAARVTAELLNAQASGRRTRQPPLALQQTLDRLARWLRAAAGEALGDLAAGGSDAVSVVRRVEETMTLARVEEAARTCFIGFRGIRRMRGRADLRDLEPGWRNLLCPVQTPESKDVGLVRHAAVGTRADAPDTLRDWFDLSASAALIPFINHDDPARASIGSKNLKQAVPVDQREPPLVATGWERVIGLADGTARAPQAGTVHTIEPGFITIDTVGGRRTVAFGAPRTRRAQVDNEWFVDVSVGDRVRRHQILAHAPDVRVSGRQQAELCLGVNALVALTPWYGLNYEDAIVVSASFAAKLTSRHLVRVDVRGGDGRPRWLIDQPTAGTGPIPVEAGEQLFVTDRAGGRAEVVCSPVTGELVEAFRDEATGCDSIVIRVAWPLAVGDKLTNRHQGKGVVSRILPDDQMPRLPDRLLGGRPVDVLLNPLGILRRLNIGQLWEMHAGLESLLTDGGQRLAGRVAASPRELGERLARLGAPRGRVRLTGPDGAPVGDDGVVVGPQYMVKLNHLAAAKLSVRDGQPSRSAVSQQPSAGRRYRGDHWIGSAQRLGEMEVWALEAEGAGEVLADAFGPRAAPRAWENGKPRASLRSVQAHLAAGGLELLVNDSGPGRVQEAAASQVTALATAWREHDLTELPHWRQLANWDKPTTGPDLAALIAAYGDDPDGSVYTGGDPLYRPDVHGPAGSPESEQVRYSIPLPCPMRHPWTPNGGPDLPLLTSIPVLPPAFRVAGPRPMGLDRAYADLAGHVVRHEKALEAGQPADWLLSHIHEAVKTILWTGRDSVGRRLAGKRGLLSRYLLGQAVVFSGRGVIVPDLDLDPDQVGLPRPLAHGLGMNGLDEDDDVVIVNRQPSLHPYNLVALRARLVDGDAIHLHPLCLGGLAGDFDGDTVAVHRPTTHAARHEAWQKLSPARRIRSRAAGAVLAKMDLDIALGLYRASLHPAHGLPAPLSAAQPLDAATLPQAIDDLVSGQPAAEAALALLGQVEKTGLAAAVGWSIGALDLLADGEAGHLSEARAAGVAGGDAAVAQLLHARGRPAANSGHSLSVVPDVAGCYLTGLTTDDYFATSPVALAELAHKKLTTPRAGTLTKALVAIADPVVVAEADCGRRSDRSPLTCLSETGVCQSCYGPSPGQPEPPPIGSRVGVLAATVIGERSTQEAMKAFQGGGGGGQALGSALDELFAIFGLARSTALDVAGRDDRSRLNLAEYLLRQGDLDDPDNRARALRPLAELAGERLGRKVAAVHVELVLRQLANAHRAQHPKPVCDDASWPTITLRPQGDTFIVKKPPVGTLEPAAEAFVHDVVTLLETWVPVIVPSSGRTVRGVRLRPTKAPWGDCRRQTDRLDLSSGLVGRRRELLAYAVIHALAHVHSPRHGSIWQSLMNACLPGWRVLDLELKPGSLAAFAQWRGRSAFEFATNRGSLAALVDTDRPGIGGCRTTLAAGGRL
jgi:hypothetical protein